MKTYLPNHLRQAEYKRGKIRMDTREKALAFCNALPDVVEDYPFHDSNWALMRHRNNRKTFACIYEHLGNIWINVKCDPEWRDFWRSAFSSVVPAYHMNKEHWLSLSEEIPLSQIFSFIGESYQRSYLRNVLRVEPEIKITLAFCLRHRK